MDIRIQQRLVGALVILALVFLIVPVLLDGEGRIPEKITQIPPKPKRPDLSHIRVAEPAQDVLATLPEEAPVAEAAPEEGVDEPVETEAPAQPEAEAPKEEVASSEPAIVGKAWSVQVASFKDSKKAAELRDELRGQGYKTYVNEVILSDGTLFTQVLVGPDTELERVRTLKEDIKNKTGMQGLVVRFQP